MTEDGSGHTEVIRTVRKKNRYFLHNFAIMFGKRHSKCTGKLLVERMPTSSNKCCYSTLEDEKVAIARHGARTDTVQEQLAYQ